MNKPITPELRAAGDKAVDDLIVALQADLDQVKAATNAANLTLLRLKAARMLAGCQIVKCEDGWWEVLDADGTHWLSSADGWVVNKTGSRYGNYMTEREALEAVTRYAANQQEAC